VLLELIVKAGLPVSEHAVTIQELGRAEEVFVTGTTSDVLPVVTLDGCPVGSGSPGPLTRQLATLLARALGTDALD
jgi:D-alanine transaminase